MGPATVVSANMKMKQLAKKNRQMKKCYYESDCGSMSWSQFSECFEGKQLLVGLLRGPIKA